MKQTSFLDKVVQLKVGALCSHKGNLGIATSFRKNFAPDGSTVYELKMFSGRNAYLKAREFVVVDDRGLVC